MTQQNNLKFLRVAKQQQICRLYCRNNKLVACTDRESLVLYDSNVLELYSTDEGPSRTTVTEGLHLKPLQPSAGPIFSLHPIFSSFIHNLHGKPALRASKNNFAKSESNSSSLSSDSFPIPLVAAENSGRFNCST